MSSIVMDKETIFTDELIRENARLTVRHEADQQTILALSDQVELLEAEVSAGQGAVEDCDAAMERAGIAEAKLAGMSAKLEQAIRDLLFVMAGGDSCKVCTRKCAFGASECKPVWRGEETEEAEE